MYTPFQAILIAIFVIFAPILTYKLYYDYRVYSFEEKTDEQLSAFFREKGGDFLADNIPYVFENWNVERYLKYSTLFDKLNNGEKNADTLDKAKNIYGSLEHFNGCEMIYAGKNRGHLFELDNFGARYKCSLTFKNSDILVYLSLGTKHGEDLMQPIQLFIHDIYIRD